MNFKDKLQEAFEAGYLQGLSESTTIDTSSYRRSHGKSPNPNESPTISIFDFFSSKFG